VDIVRSPRFIGPIDQLRRPLPHQALPGEDRVDLLIRERLPETIRAEEHEIPPPCRGIECTSGVSTIGIPIAKLARLFGHPWSRDAGVNGAYYAEVSLRPKAIVHFAHPEEGRRQGQDQPARCGAACSPHALGGPHPGLRPRGRTEEKHHTTSATCFGMRSGATVSYARVAGEPVTHDGAPTKSLRSPVIPARMRHAP
jgi:hypothetical protein